MRKKEFKEGLADLAQRAEMDHEVQMARADLYKIAKYSIKLHEILKGISEAEGLEGWQQAKITKAADYISSVFHSLDYDVAAGQMSSTPIMKAESIYKKSLSNKLTAKLSEKAVSQNQQQAAGIALKHKREGSKPPAGSASASMMSMSVAELEKIAGTKHKGLPDTVSESKVVCKDCGKPSYTTLPEEKQKGVDGKVCWKGYKRMGTKMKGGKRVDNCVKM